MRHFLPDILGACAGQEGKCEIHYRDGRDCERLNAASGSQPRNDEGASHFAWRGKNAEAFLINCGRINEVKRQLNKLISELVSCLWYLRFHCVEAKAAEMKFFSVSDDTNLYRVNILSLPFSSSFLRTAAGSLNFSRRIIAAMTYGLNEASL